MSWSAKQYVAFENERTRPVRDLLSIVPKTEVRRAIDIGCGPGNSTEVLAGLFPDAKISGIDSSPDMIEAARKRLPRISFEVAAAEEWSDPGPFDVILANAVFQWVPDHAKLFPRLVERLAPGGHLAVQMPDNLNETAHQLMREVAAQSPWAEKLAGAAGRRTRIESVGWYYDLLRPLCSRVNVWRTTYYHSLKGSDAIAEWFKGSGLRPFLAALDESEREPYLDRYRAALAKSFPVFSDGNVLLPFTRQFFVATR
jgi:trans-aconitate 2-methyltransferase